MSVVSIYFMPENIEGRVFSRENCEIPLQERETPWGKVRYLFGRSSFSESKDLPNQDFLVCFYDNQRVVFVVSDGVSGAWASQIAAEKVSKRLARWLWDNELNISDDEVREQVAQYLEDKVKPLVNQYADQHPLSLQFLPGDVARDVEIRAKDKIGSETTFLAGKVDLGPTGTDGRVTLVWMGNTKAMVHRDNQWVDVGNGDWNDQNRFSSKRGLQGTLSVWSSQMTDVDQIAVYTDGMEAINVNREGESGEATSLDVEKIMSQHGTLPSYRPDDVTFLNLDFRPSEIISEHPAEKGGIEIGLLIGIGAAILIPIALIEMKMRGKHRQKHQNR